MLGFISSERNKPVLNYMRLKEKVLQRMNGCRQQTCSSAIALTSDNAIELRSASPESCLSVHASK